MSHYEFIAISPISMSWQDTVHLRRALRRGWDRLRLGGAACVTNPGDGEKFIEDEYFARYSTCSDFALENARLLRRNHALWIRFDGRQKHAFETFCTTHTIQGSVSAHIVLGRGGALCLVVTFDFNGLAGATSFGPREIRQLHERMFLEESSQAALSSFLRENLLAHIATDKPVQPGRPLAEATHIVTVLIGGAREALAPYQAVHTEEEGSAESLIDTTGQSGAVADYLRFGWSYTTIALKGYTKEILLANLMIYMQNLWFTQKTLREQLGVFDYETSGNRADRTVAVELEALNIERTFAENEVEDFRANLKPWLRSACDYVHGHWAIGETREKIDRIVADLRAYYERKLDVYENRQSKRQANVLFWIALLQFVAIYEGVGAYFSFLDMSEVETEPMFHSAVVATAVVASPLILTAVSLYAAYLYFRDSK